MYQLIDRPREVSQHQKAFDVLDAAYGTDEFSVEDAIIAIMTGLEINRAQATRAWNMLVDNVNVSDGYTI